MKLLRVVSRRGQGYRGLLDRGSRILHRRLELEHVDRLLIDRGLDLRVATGLIRYKLPALPIVLIFALSSGCYYSIAWAARLDLSLTIHDIVEYLLRRAD